ncbi:MAG: hypothetical protein AAFV77_12295 [Planctomycetota bacterium]
MRCAERVRPLFTYAWPKAKHVHIDAVDRAISIAKDIARRGVPDSGTTQDGDAVTAIDARAAANAAYITAGAAYGATSAHAAAAAAAESAAHAASAASEAVDTIASDVGTSFAAHGGDASYASTAANYAVNAHPAAAKVVLHDFDALLAMAEREGWTNTTPVDPDALGPLWPEGWPDVTSKVWESIEDIEPPDPLSDPIAGPVRVYIDPTAYRPDEAGQLLSILSELYELEYGDRLVIDSTGTGERLVVVPVYSPGGAS